MTARTSTRLIWKAKNKSKDNNIGMINKNHPTKLRFLCLICIFCMLFTACSNGETVNWETWDPTTGQTSGTTDSSSPSQNDPDEPAAPPTFTLQSGTLMDGVVSGNPILLTGTNRQPFTSLNTPNASQVTVCGKNLLQIKEDQVDRNKNNISFDFDAEKGSISITSSGATASTLASATSAVLNGEKTSGVLFSFRFPTDTLITISANCNDAHTYRQDVYLQIHDGTNIYRDTGEGYAFIAKANTDYGVRLFVREGVVCNNLVFKPQIELGGCKTAFEPYNGLTAKLSASSSENMYAPNTALSTEYYSGDTVDCVFHHQNGTVYVSASAPSAPVICFDKSNDQRVNGKHTYYLQKFSFEEDTPVTVSGIPAKYSNLIRLQVTDGTKILADRGNGVSFTAKAHTEYAIRIYVAANAIFNSIALKPVIATGVHALMLQNGTTTIFTDTPSAITVETAANIVTPEKPTRKPMITFIDDDTTRLEYVKIFHDIFAAKGLTANYAVITQQLEKDPALLEALLQYEKEGFGMLYHCDYQSGNKTLYWQSGANRDMAQAEANFKAGLEKMEAFGFSNYKYWVSPYGVYDAAMQNLAKKYGMECLISYNKNSFIGEGGNCSRFNIPRYALSATGDNNLPHIMDAIDACVMENGWIIITTHVNEWDGQYDEMSQKVSDLIQYALDNGMEIVTFEEGYEIAKDWFQN